MTNLIPSRNVHASLAFAYFMAEASIDDEESDRICSDLFDKWGTAWDEMGLSIDCEADSEA